MAIVVAFLVAVTLIVRLAWVQVVWGPDLAAKAEQQRTRTFEDPARRGTIADRNGTPLAYTMQSRYLTVSPNILRKEMADRHRWYPTTSPDVDTAIDNMANGIASTIQKSGADSGHVDAADIKTKLHRDSNYEVLVRNLDPDIAADIARTYDGVTAIHQDVRYYPNGAVGENIVGKLNGEGNGQFGYEAYADSQLSGSNGSSVGEVSEHGQVIPGTLHDKTPAINGANVDLTIDVALQAYVQQQIEQAKAASGAHSVSAVVLDAKTAEVLAMANTDTIDPTGDIGKQLKEGKTFGNLSVTTPFEPGSVAKIITAAAAIEDHKTTPDEVLNIPPVIKVAGTPIRDAWPHGNVQYTTTGVFGKSSNIGTLILARRVGEDRFADMLHKFGIGQPTHVELPGESQGTVPPRAQWEAGTFANLPIGQGMLVTLLQMADMYQAIANDGLRVEPRIVKKMTRADGTVVPTTPAATTRVVSPETARTLRVMFQSVTQRDKTGANSGTGPGAAVAGYQIAGKTGTAQQFDQNCHCYSNSDYWITFAGIAPADNPRFVIAIMMDRPKRGPHGEGGHSAAPLFHDIAAWLLNRDNVPLSPPRPGPPLLKLVP